MTPQLKISIDKLYEAFSTYPGSPHMDGSPNYSDLETWNRELFSKPLAELTANELSRFTGKVMTTWGNVNDFKHFLPRIFELTAQFDTPYEVGIAFGKLEYGNWQLWEEAEREVILQYMQGLWQSLLNDNTEKAEWNFMDYFSSLAHTYPVFTDLLAIWEKENSKTATIHLANFIFNERANIFDKGALSGFYKNAEHIKELKAWLISDKIINRLQQAFFAAEKEAYSETISWAEKILTDEKRNEEHKKTFDDTATKNKKPL